MTGQRSRTIMVPGGESEDGNGVQMGRAPAMFRSRRARTVLEMKCSLALYALVTLAGPVTAHDTQTALKQERERHAKIDSASMVLIPAGPFMMGRPDAAADEQPVHRVLLGAFYIDGHEITVAEYAKFLEEEDVDPPLLWQETRNGDHLQKPVLGVDWYDAGSYCRWSNKRLPTEAEWEKAARGTDGRMYPWGNAPPAPRHANFGREKGQGYSAVATVGSFGDGRSPYGVLDMAGNVWEWVADRYDEHYYQHSPENNPRGPASGPLRVLRGGAWNSAAPIIAATNRSAHVPSVRRGDVGFRCARDAPKESP
ncbi:MAG TPA: formylglycine-generating enzyme family protein [Nitrospira sp.]|nr:formylglycine-generating enzyme family protein [Nitrospira sp.]